MKYVSTRDRSISCTFEEAIFAGYAPGGGLFVPESVPTLGIDRLQAWSSLSFADLAFEVLRCYIAMEEVSDGDLRSICQLSFHDGFDAPDDVVVPVLQVGNLYVSELFHGPTFCFKDLGMRALINLLAHFSVKRCRTTTLLVATTGDTGPAAAKAVCDSNCPYLRIIVHFPLGQISDFQRKQLTTLKSPFLKVVSFEGGGDDMDRPIKDILTEQHKLEQYQAIGVLCGVNSYNIGRPLLQMIHALWTYFRVVEQEGGTIGTTTVDFILPTGAMGNMTGAYLVKQMGVPIGYLCAGVNINDITHRVVQTGKFHRADTMKMTLSEALNIQVPYNFERILYYLTGANDKLVRKWMLVMEAENKLDLDEMWLQKLRAEFRSARITDLEMCAEIRQVKEDYDYYIDPHTAVAFSTATKLGYTEQIHDALKGDEGSVRNPVAIFATASPCKFEEALVTALGKDGWESFLEYFPPRGKATLTEKETAPIIYKYGEGKELVEVQAEWKYVALSLVRTMGVALSLKEAA